MYQKFMFLARIEKFHLKIIIFSAVKYRSILHGHVCVMLKKESARFIRTRYISFLSLHLLVTVYN